MDEPLLPTLFDYGLTDAILPAQSVTIEEAECLLSYFKECSLFRWKNLHNNCEARAEAVCLLLDAWNIPNYKAWVFSGAFLKNHIGGLKQLWNYHVAALLQVHTGDGPVYYIIDPSTAAGLSTLNDWAANVTDYPHSYHFIKESRYYIFPSGKIKKDNWHIRNRQNKKWTFQGLAGINGVTKKGKAQLCFQKKRIAGTKERFELLKRGNPILNMKTVVDFCDT
jgi:Glutaminase